MRWRRWPWGPDPPQKSSAFHGGMQSADNVSARVNVTRVNVSLTLAPKAVLCSHGHNFWYSQGTPQVSVSNIYVTLSRFLPKARKATMSRKHQGLSWLEFTVPSQPLGKSNRGSRPRNQDGTH